MFKTLMEEIQYILAEKVILCKIIYNIWIKRFQEKKRNIKVKLKTLWYMFLEVYQIQYKKQINFLIDTQNESLEERNPDGSSFIVYCKINSNGSFTTVNEPDIEPDKLEIELHQYDEIEDQWLYQRIYS